MDLTKPAFDQPLLFSQSLDQTAAKFRLGLEALGLRRGGSRTPNPEGCKTGKAQLARMLTEY